MTKSLTINLTYYIIKTLCEIHKERLYILALLSQKYFLEEKMKHMDMC